MIVDRYTKAVLTVIAACLLALCAKTLWTPGLTVHGAGTEVQFSADKDRLYFFDPATQKVYAFTVAGGHVQGILQVTKGGSELKPLPSY